ncbi:MAG: DUF2279 domain-containing protein [Bacteroidales bacterium]|nr:DUF2279 domain-containing protein [Bacteroidales bacterium]
MGRLLNHNIYIIRIWMLLLAIFICNQTWAQHQDSISRPEFNQKRFNALVTTGAVGYTATMFGLYQLWYKDYGLNDFHFYNDNNEWRYFDKLGHSLNSYYLGSLGYNTLKWAGLDENKCIWYGGTFGLFFQTSFEMLDGLSEGWGASPGDMIANTAGTALFVGQQLLWHEQRMMLKWSLHLSPYAQYRPNVLGSTVPERLLKDYNGQTFWISTNIASFLPKDSRFPKWLNVALGYSVDGLTGGAANVTEYNGNPVPQFNRQSQYFLSLDVDLSKIPTKNEHLKLLLEVLGFVKIPFPALELNANDGLKFRAFYF